MSKEKQPQVGRPPVKELERKRSFTVSCTDARRKALIKKYGSLTKALEAIEI